MPTVKKNVSFFYTLAPSATFNKNITTIERISFSSAMQLLSSNRQNFKEAIP